MTRLQNNQKDTTSQIKGNKRRGSKSPCANKHDRRIHNHNFIDGYCSRCGVKF